jgi:hypothetical protein
MGNYLSNTNNDTEVSNNNLNTYIPYKLNNTSVDPLYLTKLRYWERDIQWKNWNVNNDASNIPQYMKNLRSWESKIQKDNYQRWNSASNIPLSYRLI